MENALWETTEVPRAMKSHNTYLKIKRRYYSVLFSILISWSHSAVYFHLSKLIFFLFLGVVLIFLFFIKKAWRAGETNNISSVTPRTLAQFIHIKHTNTFGQFKNLYNFRADGLSIGGKQVFKLECNGCVQVWNHLNIQYTAL